MDQAWKAKIEKEYASLQADEEILHNKDLHRDILANWKVHSPKMWANLQKAGASFPDKLAYVLQERMWKESDLLMKGGMPYTDAQEQAERDNLMLEPEADLEESERDREERYGRLSQYTPDLPKSVLKT